MTDQQVGAVFRAIRRRHGWRQEDVAKAAGVDQKYISLAERGRLEQLPLRATRRIAAALEIDLRLAPRWHGPELGRLLDRGHAHLVEDLAARFVAQGWQVLPEYSFNHFGERGSVDLVGWHREHRALALSEVKTLIVDQQDLLSSNGRKFRIVPALLARERGWEPASVGNLLVVLDTSTNRRVVAAHPTTFAASFPERSVATRAWVAMPAGPLAGLWFLSPKILVPTIQPRGGSVRVRVPRKASDRAQPRVAEDTVG